MTVILSGNDFKYEVEATIKLFLPVTNFTFLYDEFDLSGDYCILRQKIGRKYTHFFVSASIGGKRKRMHSKTDKNNEKDYEITLCRTLYKCMVLLTGKAQPWGCLTGIRPVKKVNALIAEGCDKSAVFSALREKYFTSDEKLELAWNTAVTQAKFLAVPEKSFSLYVSIPFCPTRCSYCSFVSHSVESAAKLIPQYIEKLCDEIAVIAEYADKLELSLDTVYFGGGTPTSLSAEHLDTLMKAVASNFTLDGVREYTVEAGRADTITAEKLQAIKENGATRISINPQTMNDSVLAAIGRRHTSEQVREAFSLARKIGFDNINTDLIAGLPTDTLDSFRATVDAVIGMNPENITVHTLTLKRSSTLFQEKDIVSDAEIADMISFSSKALAENGYNPYYLYRQKNTLGNLENVGYSRAGYEGLYNIFIMEEMQTILAAGASASTKLCVNGKIKRVYNYKFPYEYINRFDEMMTKKSEITQFYSHNQL